MASHKQNDSSAGFQPVFKSFATDAIHVGSEPEQWNSMAVVPPISLSTTFKQHEPGKHAGFEYSRSGNPTRNCLERAVAALDGAQYCLAVASGLAATLTITHLFKAGDGILCMNDVYGGTNRYFRKIAAEVGLDVSFADLTKLEELKAALKPNTKMVWIETPTNPTMKVVDIQGCADIVHEHNKDTIVVVDNTFMSAYFQRPLALGADICMYSATKYMNGHSDVVMGLISLNREDLYERLKFLQNALGAVPSPFDCYMCNRGLKTLHLRMKQHFKNALAAAQFLEADPRVDRVIFPGLPSHPQYELTKRQCTGCPGMITFYIKGKLEHASTFLSSLKLFALAESLGGYESLAEHPAIMTHASVPENERKELGISDTLIRLSVGLEDEEDIIADLDQALSAANDSSAGFQPAFKSFATDAIHVGSEPEQWNSMAVVPPISLSTTFKQHSPGKHAMLWIETPTNPTMKVVDIQGCADIVHEHNKDTIVVVDNTFMSAYFQKLSVLLNNFTIFLIPGIAPLALGADICMYSATKYMNGHTDVVMGLISLNRGDLYERLKFLQSELGAVPSPFDCYMCNRGLKTLHLRMKQHFKNALAAAQFLEADPRVERVVFPGLPSHPQYELTKRQCTGCPGMITFYIKGKLEHASTFLSSLKVL
ncbi:Cystathionine gamma-lyase [Anabarilius grahami]|uniref:Cystathionine gamma-lyase n=1 Tax=Anabarilius grahami TaxID=495550 RepID=A0A3N0YEA7_ANAGA|nr:Cystathionine gamma-lyase [Anabarilius grahami]